MQLLDCKVIHLRNALNISAIMGYEETIIARQMKHGINIEPFAGKNIKLWIKRLHQDMVFTNPGMSVFNGIV